MRRCGFERHCGIVTRICLVRGGRRGEATTLVTASRDGTLKCWDALPNETHGGSSSSTSPPVTQLRCSLEEHTAWVNDAVVLPTNTSSADAARDSRRIISASNDNLVKVWHVDEEKQGAGVAGALLTLRYHVDYVTCLAYAPQRMLLVSAGLDSRVVVTDLEAATRVLNMPSGDPDEQYGGQRANSASPHRGPSATAAQPCMVGSFSGAGQYIPQLLASPSSGRSASRGYAQGYEQGGRGGYSEDSSGRQTNSCGASVWSLATMRSASLLACGTASCVVRGWDPRSGARLWSLRGHTENVRALVLSEDGTVCISGSADRTVRVWDVGMRRCVHIFDAHHDSVWALGVAGYSCGWADPACVDGAGGAGGSMLGEVFSGGRDGLVLVHDLRLLQTGLVVREPSPLQALAVPTGSGEVWASAADSHVRRHAVPSSLVPYGSPAGKEAETVPPPGAAPSPMPALPPAAGDECIVVHGTPRLTEYKVLHNKRQVLVRDACDQLSLWDVTTGQFADIATPAAPVKEAGVAIGGAGTTGSASQAGNNKDEVMKRALAQVNKPVSVPNWFSCDLALGSLSVYLDANQCFKAEAEGSSAPVNLGARTLRALFDSWVRLPPGGAQGASVQAGGRSSSSTPTGYRRASGAYPRVFVAPPALHEPNKGGGERWDDDQPPGTPADQGGNTELPTGGFSAASFPPATALVLVGRNGRAAGYRGRLYCGLFNGTEVPDLLPPWAVDIVWKQRLPPEELLGERTMMFSLVRCSSEMSLPLLSTPYCASAPRTPVRRLMGYIVRTLDFDWASPAKTTARRPASAVSLVSRLGRCCTVPTTRGRGGGGEQWNGQDSGDSPPLSSAPRGSSSSRRGRSSSQERSSGSGGQGNSSSSGGGRRSFGLRRGDEEANGSGNGAYGRVRIDGSPLPVTSVQAQPHGSTRRSGGGSAAASLSGGAQPDERFVEILCNDVLVDPDMSLATVRDFVWRKPGHELVLQYRRAKRTVSPTSPMPPPPLMPGGQQQNTAASASAAAAPGAASGGSDDRIAEDMTSELNGLENSPSPGPGSGSDNLDADGHPRE